ncbi:MAG: DUF4340 domain-containing protein [Deltaproteobacteria bacterium]|nr:DUF4340 domain-containing protein [Deltaproteobacteria bacterium]
MSSHKVLALLFVLQLALVAMTWWPRDHSALAPRPLFELESDAIQELRVEASGDGEGVRLVREGRDWKVASASGYPANPEKVDELLDSLLALRVTTPIATRETSHNALKVGEDEYGKRVVIVAGDGAEIELVIGAAARDSVHVREADASEVYVAKGLSEWSLQDRGDAYYDRSYVDTDAATLSTLTVTNGKGTLTFVRDEVGWVLEGLEGAAEVDQAAVDALIKALTKLNMSEPVGIEALPQYALDGRVSVTWSAVESDQSFAGGYVVGADEGSFTFVKADGNPFVVKANSSDLEALRSAQRSDFLVRDREDEAGAAAARGAES